VLVGVTRRWALGAALAVVAGGVVGGLPARPAAAAKPKPTIITIAGDGLDEPLAIRLDEKPQIFAAVHDEVAFLSGKAHIAAPKAKGLGPKYTLVVHYDDKPRFTYDLYPLASGGPKAFRPAKQPDKAKTAAGWFLGHLGMSETLRAAGVPLPVRPDVMSGGIGGGERAVPDNTLDYDRDLDKLFAELQRVLLLNGAVVLFITSCLAGIALLVRQRTR
jgi:hypothetical protein